MISQSVPYVVHDAAGRILRYGRAPASEIAAQAGPGETALAGLGDDAADWVNPQTGLLEQRPAVALPEQAAVLVGAEWEVGHVPDGTVVLVDGDEVGVVAGGDALVLQFSTAAFWAVELRPPFPHRRATCLVLTS